MTLQHPAMFLFFCAAILLLSGSWLRVSRPWIFLGLSVLFAGLQLQFAAGSSALLAGAVVYHYLTLKLMLRVRPGRTRSIVFLAWLIPALLAFTVVKGYSWISGSVIPQLLLPEQLSTVGLSFLLFRQIDLAVSVRDGLVDSVPPVTYLNYNLAFWTFLAGPVQRYENFRAEFSGLAARSEPPDVRPVLIALNRILTGLIKMFVVASFFERHTTATEFTATPTPVTFAVMLLSYPLYLYINFSGYCDIVIGVAAAVGFELPENFRHPYLARNSLEFWTRWHITLSEFFRDYVYQPLYIAMARRGTVVWMAAGASTLASFALMGAWHGNRPGFVVFGLLHGSGVLGALAWEAFLKAHLSPQQRKFYRTDPAVKFCCIVVFQMFVVFSFLPYRFTGEQLRGIGRALGTMLRLAR